MNYLRGILLTLVFAGNVLCCWAQADSPVSWAFKITKTTDRTYELHCIATIAHPWHIYSQDIPASNDVLFPTTFSFVKHPLIILHGKPKEIGELIQKHEKSLGIDLKYYEGQVEFVQTLTVRNNAKTELNGVIEFMACTNSGCLPPVTRAFTVILNK